jgi:DNA-binding NtrC family response regulator
MNSILLVEDDPSIQALISMIANQYGHITATSSALEAKKQATTQRPDLVIIDLYLHGELQGIELIHYFESKEIPTIVLSSETLPEIVEQVYLAGCKHFFPKRNLRKSLTFFFQQQWHQSQNFDWDNFFKSDFITTSENLRSKVKRLSQVPLKNSSLLIEGETGVGKGQLAKFFHQRLSPQDAPFIHLNCSEFSESLLESELFGHVKGAFTGANQAKQGKLQLADGGTLFLDEVGTMSLGMQQKLLVALEERSWYPVGSSKKMSAQFTLITASCDKLHQLIDSKKFREDLFYRIANFHLHIPALRERSEDIQALINFFLSQSLRQVVIQPEAMQKLHQYHYPGNIRELKSIVEKISFTPSGIVTAKELQSLIQADSSSDEILNPDQKNYIIKHGLRPFFEQVERESIKLAEDTCSGKVTEMISLLGVSSSALYRMKKLLS